MDQPTDAQKALGIKPTEPTAEELAQEAELAKSDKSEDDAFADDFASEKSEEDNNDDEKKPDEGDQPDDEGKKDEPAKDKSKKPENTVPFDLHLDEIRKRKDAEARLAEYEKANGDTEKKQLIKDMAADLGLDEVAAEKLFNQIEKVAATKAKTEPQEIAVSTEEREAAEKAHFTNEYDDFSDEFTKLYPNATPQMRKEAKQKLYELARSEQYGIVEGKHDAYPLDYIVAKERKTFDILLKVAPKDKSTESSRDFSKDDDLGTIDFTSPDMSPEKYKQYQAQKQARRMKSDKVRFV